MRIGALSWFLLCGTLLGGGSLHQLAVHAQPIVEEAYPVDFESQPLLQDDGYRLNEPKPLANDGEDWYAPSNPPYYYDGCGVPSPSGCSAGGGSEATCGEGWLGCEPGVCGEVIPCCVPRWDFLAEVTFFRYDRNNGLRVGDDAPGDDVADKALQGAPRLSLMYNLNEFWGIRGRWWEYHTNRAAVEGRPSFLDVDAETFDLELVRRFYWNCNWDFVLSGGFRRVAFQETLSDQVGDLELGVHAMNTTGFVGGFEAYRHLCCGDLFARVRGSFFEDDMFRTARVSGNEVLVDRSTAIWEIALGYRHYRPLRNGMTLYGEIAGEYQSWHNFTSDFNLGAADPESVWAGSSNVSFIGLTLGAGLMF